MIPDDFARIEEEMLLSRARTDGTPWVPDFPEGPQPAGHVFVRPGQVSADRPRPDACMTCGQPENGHARPLTYDAADVAYSLPAARDRYAELADRDLNAATAAKLRERGEFDPGNLGHRLVAEAEPLTAAERLERLAVGEVMARYYRHPSLVDDVVRAGASWEQIGAARGTTADRARQDYRDWADSQHGLLGWTDGRFGMSDADHAAAIAAAGPSGGRDHGKGNGEMKLMQKDAMLTELDDETIIDLFAYACESHDEGAADALEAEIERRGIYGRKRAMP